MDSDAAFDREQRIVTKAAEKNQEKWGLDEEWIEDTLVPHRTLWEAKYAAWEDPVTRNKQITFEKNEARRNYEPLVRQLISDLQHSMAVTDDEKEALGIYIAPHSTQPLPATKEKVEFEVETDTLRRLTIQFRVEKSKSKAKPHGVSSLELKWAILPKRPDKMDELTEVDSSTRSPLVLDFEEDERGKVVYFCGRWVMKSSQSGFGPWSTIDYAVIP
jgi:hypothetical protein